MPSAPDKVYEDGGWQGWGHWLGTGNQAGGAKAFLPFGEALTCVQSLGLASQNEWWVWCTAYTTIDARTEVGEPPDACMGTLD